MNNIIQGKTKEIGLKNVFSFIIDGLLLFFLIILGVETIKLGQLVIGFLYFVLSLLIFVPHHFLRVTHSLKIVIIIILFIIVATISGKITPLVEQKYDHFTSKQAFNLTLGGKPFSMEVKEIKYDAQLATESKDTLTTSGSFIVVTVDIINLSPEAAVFKLGANPELIDSQNRHYTLLGEGLTVGKLQPGVAKEVPYTYEVPKDALELKFVVKDSTKIAKSVDLSRY